MRVGVHLMKSGQINSCPVATIILNCQIVRFNCKITRFSGEVLVVASEEKSSPGFPTVVAKNSRLTISVTVNGRKEIKITTNELQSSKWYNIQISCLPSSKDDNKVRINQQNLKCNKILSVFAGSKSR